MDGIQGEFEKVGGAHLVEDVVEMIQVAVLLLVFNELLIPVAPFKMSFQNGAPSETRKPIIKRPGI